MKRIAYVTLAVCWLSAACSGEPPAGDETVGVALEELNGALNPRGFLTRKSFPQTDEVLRQATTQRYYDNTGVGANGSTSSGTISSQLGTLVDFQVFYGISGLDPIAYYYNRGDLGIGREMRCADRMSDPNNEQIACFVKNYAAGDDASPEGGDASEFIFGMSPSIAFANMTARRAFATVAMVFRNKAPVDSKVIFAVYDAEGNLAIAAPLDRHGLHFANAFKHDTHPDPSIFGTPGVTFNNTIPSNCSHCHGGIAGSSEQALFLPFDLDQFEFENVPGRTRGAQLDAFRRLNEAVRKAAALSGTPFRGPSIKNQLDGWYNNTRKTNDKTEVFENAYNSNFVPSGWNASAASRRVYRSVVRGNCRGCHMASSVIYFDSESEFLNFAPSIAENICINRMPHALQALREFWQSTAPAELESYYRGAGLPHTIAAANALRECSPGNIVTLDPHLIGASSVLL